MNPPVNHTGSPLNGRFATTEWSKIVRAAVPDTAEARTALADLCQSYWYPLYAYLRRRGVEPSAAEDTVQAFFASILENNLFGRANPERGRFRGFLVAALRQFLHHQNEFESAAKRKPTTPIVSIDSTTAEGRYFREPAHDMTPERAFEYTWAVAVLDRASEGLRIEFESVGQAERFRALRVLLSGDSKVGAQQVGQQLGISEGAVRVALHRLRQRFGELLRAEVSATLDEGEDVEAELRDLQNALRFGRGV
jgi:RNA polymerase sigma factor (sigma-70 family)